MKAIWKESINFGLVNIPVKLYSAIETSVLDFDLLNQADLESLFSQTLIK
jgi:DNA end-binding protein Ku